MYNLFIKWLIKFMYFHIVKPVILLCRKIFFISKYLVLALSGNLILIGVALFLWIWCYHKGFLINEPSLFGAFAIVITGAFTLCVLLLLFWNCLQLFGRSERNAISGEPLFIQNIIKSVDKILQEVIKDERQKKEKIAGEKAIKMEKKRKEKEKKEIELNTIHSRSEILDIRE